MRALLLVLTLLLISAVASALVISPDPVTEFGLVSFTASWTKPENVTQVSLFSKTLLPRNVKVSHGVATVLPTQVGSGYEILISQLPNKPEDLLLQFSLRVESGISSLLFSLQSASQIQNIM